MTIGEIDSRISDGFWSLCKKEGTKISNIVRETVTAYLGWVERVLSAKSPGSVTIQGISARRYFLDVLRKTNEHKEFFYMIQQVNNLLREGALARNWCFLDVHGTTADANGVFNQAWHLDEYHLKPSFYSEEPSKCIIRPPA